MTTPYENGIKSIEEYRFWLENPVYHTEPLTDEENLLLGIQDHPDMSILVPDAERFEDDQVQAIAQNSCKIALALSEKFPCDYISGTKCDTMEIPVGNHNLTIETGAKLLLPRSSNDETKVFTEGPFEIRMKLSENPYSMYTARLNFREVELNGKPELIVCLDDIQKGVRGEWLNRKRDKRFQDKEEVQNIENAKAELSAVENELGCSLREVMFDLAFSFARSVGAKGFMAIDEESIASKQHYNNTGVGIPFYKHNWILMKNGMFPPSEKNPHYWTNIYPNRLDGNLSIEQALFDYHRSGVQTNDHYRNMDERFPQKAIDQVISVYEDYLKQIYPTDETQE